MADCNVGSVAGASALNEGDAAISAVAAAPMSAVLRIRDTPAACALSGIFFVIRTNHREAITVVSQDSNYLFRFTKDASFINKNEFRRKLRALPDNSQVVFDGTRALFIDHDIREIVEDFRQLASHKGIQIETKGWESHRC